MPTRKILSSRQKQILDFIAEFVVHKGLPPTVRDIQAACSISSTSVVDYNLRLLKRDGYLNRRPDVARGIELIDERGRPASASSRIRLVGNIAAGQPLPVFSNESSSDDDEFGEITVPSDMVKSSRPHFALKVKGMSMVDALVGDGDIVLVEKVAQAENGDMVVAWLKLEEEATLKRLYREGELVRLQPANSEMLPIYCAADNVEVQGKVVGVLRMG